MRLGSGFCEGFRMTAHRDDATWTGAVVRKPPGEETAMGERVAVPRALWGFDRSGCGFEVRRACLIAMIVELSACDWLGVEVSAGVER